VLSDGRFAVLRGDNEDGETSLSSCEALVVGHDEHWEEFPSMYEDRTNFICAAVAGCIVVAGRTGRTPNGWTRLRSADRSLRRGARLLTATSV